LVNHNSNWFTTDILLCESATVWRNEVIQSYMQFTHNIYWILVMMMSISY